MTDQEYNMMLQTAIAYTTSYFDKHNIVYTEEIFEYIRKQIMFYLYYCYRNEERIDKNYIYNLKLGNTEIDDKEAEAEN